MHGLDVFARTNSVPTGGFGRGKPFAYGNSWQYNSQSDRHSRTACWGVFFDLLNTSSLLQSHAHAGKIGLGINHPLIGATGAKKNLDLVIAKRSVDKAPLLTFRQLATQYKLMLSPAEQAVLAALPDVPVLDITGMPVLLALEAKAVMTAHGKVAKSRLLSELRDAHVIVHGNSANAIAAGFVLVNNETRFISTVVNKWPLPPLPGGMPARWSTHKQPGDTLKVVNEMAQIPMTSGNSNFGYDCFGTSVVMCRNDGSLITVVTPNPPSPPVSSPQHYDNFIHCMAHQYGMRFGHI
jgi:hypothetical protein